MYVLFQGNKKDIHLCVIIVVKYDILLEECNTRSMEFLPFERDYKKNQAKFKEL